MTKKSHCIMDEFSSDKLANHPKPTRKGMKKGYRVEFSLEKEKVVLELVRGKSQKEISEEIGMSFGVVRRFATEERVKAKVEQYRDETAFRAVAFVDELHEQTATGQSDMSTIKSRFGTPQDYGPILTEKIVLAILKKVNEKMSFGFLQTAYSVLAISGFIELAPWLQDIIEVYYLVRGYFTDISLLEMFLKSNPPKKDVDDIGIEWHDRILLEEKFITAFAMRRRLDSLLTELLKKKEMLLEGRLVAPIPFHVIGKTLRWEIK
jgi:hypothetical protein